LLPQLFLALGPPVGEHAVMYFFRGDTLMYLSLNLRTEKSIKKRISTTVIKAEIKSKDLKLKDLE
jgi:hypothetical protein